MPSFSNIAKQVIGEWYTRSEIGKYKLSQNQKSTEFIRREKERERVRESEIKSVDNGDF